MMCFNTFILFACCLGTFSNIATAFPFEPTCSKFDYEYKTLEAMLRMESYVKEVKKEITEIQQDVSGKLRQFDDIKSEIDKKIEEIKQDRSTPGIMSAQNRNFADFVIEQNKKFDELKAELNAKLVDLRSEDGFQKMKADWSDCVDVRDSGIKTSGLYTIKLKSTKELVKVICDMETDGGGWTVFQYRSDGSVDFYRNFSEYEYGFGQMDGGEFWLGLHYIYELARGGNTELRIDLTAADGSTAFEKFKPFFLSPGRDYTLNIKYSSGSLGNRNTGLLYNNGDRFSTFDNDDDVGCAKKDHGGGWFDSCAYANLNGYYNTPGNTGGYGGRAEAGMTYRSFKEYQSLKQTKMMLRRS